MNAKPRKIDVVIAIILQWGFFVLAIVLWGRFFRNDTVVTFLLSIIVAIFFVWILIKIKLLKGIPRGLTIIITLIIWAANFYIYATTK